MLNKLVILLYIDEHDARFERLLAKFQDPMTEVYLLFYQTALQTFVHFNMLLQREDPIIPIIHAQINSFLQKLATKFLTVRAVKAANGDYTTLQFKEPASQHAGNNYIMHACMCKLYFAATFLY